MLPSEVEAAVRKEKSAARAEDVELLIGLYEDGTVAGTQTLIVDSHGSASLGSERPALAPLVRQHSPP